MFTKKLFRVSLGIFLCGGAWIPALGESERLPRHQTVLDLQPVGYWPADDGRGERLRDLSEQRNHGSIHHVPWDQGLLDFTGAYQWLQIPRHAAYQTEAVTFGGWVFSRGEIYGGRWAPVYGPHKGGVLLLGHRDWHHQNGTQLFLRGEGRVDVVRDNQEDAIGTRAGSVSIARGEWQHVLFTYAAGTGRVYLNGRLAGERDGLPPAVANRDLQAGNDGYWWHQSVTSGSLDGSLRDLVWFDRALSADEVSRLYRETRPDVGPRVLPEGTILVDRIRYQHKTIGLRHVTLDAFSGLAAEERRRALEHLDEWEVQELESLGEPLVPILAAGLRSGPTSRVAARLLMKLDRPAARTALADGLPSLIESLRNAESPTDGRAAAALTLAEMGDLASEAVPALVETLDDVLQPDEFRLPRIEDLLRNSLIRALLDIDPDHPQARRVLGQALARPVLDSLDLSRSEVERVRDLAEAGRYLDALNAYRRLHHSVRATFFSRRGERDYTPVAEHNGYTYTMGEGRAWGGVEPIGAEDFRKVVQELSPTYPEAADWRDAEAPNLFRVPITRTAPDGTEQRVFLEGEHFVLDGTDEKLRGWSIFVDTAGYLHIVGGQHNIPDPRAFIPGSWERLGLSRERGHERFPLQLYWVSREPECLESFEFVGLRTDPRAIPAGYLNYMVFAQDDAGEVYLYGRINSHGWQSWGLFHYDTPSQRWKAVGGDPFDLIQSARDSHPDWFRYVSHPIRGRVPDGPGDSRPLVWAWQPAFYNFCRHGWGVRFDRTGRMHVRMDVWGLNEHGYNVISDVYAWSDDRGRSFQRADGTPVALPLTNNPAPEHNAEVHRHDTSQWGSLWFSLLRDAGYHGIPGF